MKQKASKYMVWALLGLPFIVICVRFADDTITYGQVLHQTGLWSAGMLVAALAISPLKRIPGSTQWLHSLVRHRRALGVASFAYAALHTGVYLERKWGADLIINEGLEPDLATGWIAFFLFVVLAITSNNASVRALGRSWKKLHRLVYIATALLLVHWWLAVFDRKYAYVFIVVLVLIQVPRMVALQSKGRKG